MLSFKLIQKTHNVSEVFQIICQSADDSREASSAYVYQAFLVFVKICTTSRCELRSFGRELH